MNRDLRLYSLALAIVLMLWFSPVRADYGNCAPLDIPVLLSGDDIWASYDNPGDWSTYDYRHLQPYDTSVSATGNTSSGEDCVVTAYSGTYYDGANHLWVLDDDLTCEFVGGDPGDFRAGDY